MALEVGTYISDLVITNPVGATDTKAQGDDHIRLIKAALKATFPNITGAMTKTHTQLNDPQVVTLPVGTKMLFVQTAAPAGWTKDVVHNDKALRIVSGAAGSGGTVAFTTAFMSKAVTGSNSGTAITLANLPSHTHTQNGTFVSGGESADHTHGVNIVTDVQGNHQHFLNGNTATGGTGAVAVWGNGNRTDCGNTTQFAGSHAHNVVGNTAGRSAAHSHNTTIFGETGAVGSNTTHTHTFTGTNIDLAVQYVDCIICTKT